MIDGSSNGDSSNGPGPSSSANGQHDAPMSDVQRQAPSSLLPQPPLHHVPVAHRAVGPDAAPFWRVTAAVDPNTTPLHLMPVWAVRIDPRKTVNFMHFSRSIARRLRAAEQGGDLDVHRNGSSNGNGSRSTGASTNGRTNGRTNSDEGEDDDNSDDSDEDDDEEDESMRHLRPFQRSEDGSALFALVCRVQDMPSYERVVSLVKTSDLVLDGTEPEPFQIQVPRNAAPSRNRLPEWKAFWPVSVKYGKIINALVKPSLSGASAPMSCSISPGVVDRAADAQMWANGVARSWAIKNLRRCLRTAWRAQRNGELAIAAHVTSTYPDGDVVMNGTSEGQAAIEADAWDTRISLRNPIKHAVTNVIRDVAQIRSERDWERLLVINANAANMPRDPLADPSAQRQLAVAVGNNAEQNGTANGVNGEAHVNGNGSISTSGTSSPLSSSKLLNGQDYLLNNLTLFTTHEPCVSCCMALVHSRVRAVFFINPSPRTGGCCGAGLSEEKRCSFAHDGGPYAVQEQAGLNHKFDVWRWVGDDDELLASIEQEADEGDSSIGQVRLDVLGSDA